MIFPKDVVNKVEVRKEAEKDSLSKSGTLLEEINTLFLGEFLYKRNRRLTES